MKTDFLKSGLVLLAMIAFFCCLIVQKKNFLPVSVARNSVMTREQVREEGKKMPICSVEQRYPLLSIYFEVSGKAEKTKKILHMLKKNKIPATFFISGQWMKGNKSLIRKIYQQNSEVGNFGEHRICMKGLAEKKVKREILMPHRLVRKLTGKEMSLFHIPYNEYDTSLINLITEYHYYPIAWTIDGKDWKDYGTEAIILQVLENKRLNNGAIIRLHTDGKYTAEALKVLIPALREKGYYFVKVSELIYKQNYYLDKKGCQHKNTLAK